MTNAFPFWHSSLLFLLIDMKARLVPGSLGLGITLCWTRCGSCVNMVLKDWKQSVSDFAIHLSEIIVAHSVVTRKSILDIHIIIHISWSGGCRTEALMLFIILGDIKVMGVEGLFRLQQSNYTQRREYHSIQNQLVGEISCGSKLHLFQLKNQHLSLAEQPNCDSFKYSSYPLKVGGFVLGECVQIF